MPGKLNRSRGLAIGLVVAAALTGCRDRDVFGTVDEVSALRVKMLAQVDVRPYRKEQHEALRAYFAEIVKHGGLFKSGYWTPGLLNFWMGRAELPSLCAKALIRKTDWDRIVEACTRNGFFLCADEVRAYGDAIAAMRSKLQPESLSKFESTAECRASY